MEKAWTPGKLLELSGAYWQTCALHAAVQLDVFTVLAEQRLTDAEAAKAMAADPRALAMLLNALAAMDLLCKEGETYTDTSEAKGYLSRDSEDYLGHMIRHHHHLMRSWSDLPQAVRGGALPPRVGKAIDEEEERESFLMGMFNIAGQVAPAMVRQIDLSGRRRLLDLGGGPGTYAIHFCLSHPDLEAVVCDLPTTRPFAEKTIARFGLQERITFQERDFLRQEIEGKFDVAWLSHILHGEGPQGCAAILRNAVSALKPDGVLLIHEFILDDDAPGPLFPALFSLNMLLCTETGQSYSQGQIGSMMAAAGLRDIRRINLELPSPSGVMEGRL